MIKISTMKVSILFSLILVGLSNGMVMKEQSSSSRRTFVESSATLLSGVVIFGRNQPCNALDDDSGGSSVKSQPFCVIGANGRTGTKCVKTLLERGIPVRATSRSGMYNDDSEEDPKVKNNPLLVPTICDVTIPSTIETAVTGSRAVIFAASASKAGGTPPQVDNDGLVNVAKACIKAKIPHLVIVSSGGVSKPDSPLYKFLNIFGGIMEQKIKGEDTVRYLYKGLEEGMTYTVVRPGGLTEEPPLGAGSLELNQGDIKSGRISRFDVASICIEATFYPSLTGGTTFECYNADTGKSLGSVGMSNIMKQTSTETDVISGFERRGETFEKLFTGLQRDA